MHAVGTLAIDYLCIIVLTDSSGHGCIVFTFFADCPDNRIGVEGAVAMAAAVKENATLTSLNLGSEWWL